MQPPLAAAIANMEWVHAFTAFVISDWPAEKRCAQLPGAPNHLLWTLGHLATTYDWVAMGVGGGECELAKTFQETFGFRSEPRGDAAAYPAFDEVRAVHDRMFGRVMRAARELSDADADEPPVINVGGFAKTRLDMLHRMAWHEGWHQGQLAVLRRGLGLKAIR